jgi:hypothetical protein
MFLHCGLINRTCSFSISSLRAYSHCGSAIRLKSIGSADSTKQSGKHVFGINQAHSMADTVKSDGKYIKMRSPELHYDNSPRDSILRVTHRFLPAPTSCRGQARGNRHDTLRQGLFLRHKYESTTRNCVSSTAHSYHSLHSPVKRVTLSAAASQGDYLMCSYKKEVPPIIPPEPDGPLSVREKFKQAMKQYGKPLVAVYICLSVCSLGMFYTLISCGVDVTNWMDRLGLPATYTMNTNIAKGASTFALAYVVHKIFMPLRMLLTISSIPLIKRFYPLRVLSKPKSMSTTPSKN